MKKITKNIKKFWKNEKIKKFKKRKNITKK